MPTSMDRPLGQVAPGTLHGRRPLAEELEEKYYRKAFEAVADSGKRRVEDASAFIEDLVKKARREVRLLRGRLFDPTAHHSDKLEEEEYQDQLLLRKDARQLVEHARTERLDAEKARDALLPERPEPRVSRMVAAFLMLASAIAFALTLKPLIGDAYFPDDPGQSWVLTYLLACVISAAFLLPPLVTVSFTASREWVNVLRMVVEAVFVGLSLYMMRRRLISDDDDGGKAMSYGLMIFEATLILVCEGYCAFLRGKWRERTAWLAKWGPAVGAVDTARKHEAHSGAKLQEIENLLEKHRGQVKERATLAAQAKDLEDAVEASVRAGARAALEKIHGMIVGNQWLPRGAGVRSHSWSVNGTGQS
jgi:hypothetical protein